MSTGETVPVSPVAIVGVRARIYTVLSVLLACLLVIQIFVAAAGVFTMAHQLDNGQSYSPAAWNNSGYWGIHFFNAFAITLITLLLLGASFLATALYLVRDNWAFGRRVR